MVAMRFRVAVAVLACAAMARADQRLVIDDPVQVGSGLYSYLVRLVADTPEEVAGAWDGRFVGRMNQASPFGLTGITSLANGTYVSAAMDAGVLSVGDMACDSHFLMSESDLVWAVAPYESETSLGMAAGFSPATRSLDFHLAQMVVAAGETVTMNGVSADHKNQWFTEATITGGETAVFSSGLKDPKPAPSPTPPPPEPAPQPEPIVDSPASLPPPPPAPEPAPQPVVVTAPPAPPVTPRPEPVYVSPPPMGGERPEDPVIAIGDWAFVWPLSDGLATWGDLALIGGKLDLDMIRLGGVALDEAFALDSDPNAGVLRFASAGGAPPSGDLAAADHAPEPVSLALVAAGGLALLRRRRVRAPSDVRKHGHPQTTRDPGAPGCHPSPRSGRCS